MRTLAFYLILAAVTLRSLVDLEGNDTGGLFLALLVPFGLSLVAESWLVRQVQPGKSTGYRGLAIVYLLFQMSLVMLLLTIPPRNDTFLALLIPVSMDAFLFWGRRNGILWICAFPLVMIPWLILEPEFNNVVMSVAYIGMCFLVGIYADLIQKAAAARGENLRVTEELQDAHQRLREYANQVEELAGERERLYLARELHDSVTQTVFSMNLTTQTARLLFEKDSTQVTAQLERLQELADSAMAEIKMLVAQLQPRLATDGDITSAIHRMIAERRTLDGMQVHLESSGGADYPESVTSALISIVREALTNVAKHAGTHEATVRLCLGVNPAYIEVEDQGAGFVLGAQSDQIGHLGLTEMAHRASEIGWHFSIDSLPGRGTRIRIEA